MAPSVSALARGLAFEAEAAEALGLSQTAASGALHRDRSDAKGALRLSCKSSPQDKLTYAEILRHLAEAVDLAYGTDETPALALEDRDGNQLLVMRLEDAARWVTSQQQTVERRQRRSGRVREGAKIPLALRED